MKLEFEFIPQTSWGLSLASKLQKEKWDKIRRECYAEADNTCEICNNTSLEKHCHEEWLWDDKKRIQHLYDLVCLCKTCHDVVHFGRSLSVYKKPYLEKLRLHWCKINGKDRTQFSYYYNKAKKLAEKRSQFHYIVMWAKGELK